MGHPFFRWLFDDQHHQDPPCAAPAPRVAAPLAPGFPATVRCAGCGTPNQRAAAFCQVCGGGMPSSKVVEPARVDGACATCNRQFFRGARFCQGCGEAVGRAK